METATGTSKRLRVSSNITQVSSCLVDGCTYDLSKCRDYHRRHKVCELHSKTAKVFIKGQEQRFCQQCSRFHSVVEFDEGKRSCRKRLEGHNRRRRKPQPDPLSLNSGALYPIHQGTRYLDFSSSQLFSASATNTSWSGAVKAENNSLLYSSQSPLNFSERKDLFYGSESHSYGGRENQLPFTETTGSMFSGDSVCQPTLPASSAMQYSGGSGKVVSDGLNLVTDSSRALSLLSSSSAEIGFSHLMQLEEKTSAQTVISSLNNYNCLGVESEPVESVLVSDGCSNANAHGRDLYQIAPAEPSVSGREERLSFSWE